MLNGSGAVGHLSSYDVGQSPPASSGVSLADVIAIGADHAADPLNRSKEQFRAAQKYHFAEAKQSWRDAHYEYWMGMLSYTTIVGAVVDQITGYTAERRARMVESFGTMSCLRDLWESAECGSP